LKISAAWARPWKSGRTVLKVEGRRAGKLRGAEIEPRGDHRIAMAFAVAGLAAEGKHRHSRR